MVIAWVLVWLLTAALAYYNTKATFVEDSHIKWDGATRKFMIISSFLLGPVFLLISFEVRLLTAIGKGLAANKTQRYKDI